MNYYVKDNDGGKSMQKLIMIALMLANILIALETTILNTVANEITSDLGGKDLMPWVFAIYILASTTFIPIFGKWATKYGCKKVFLIALTIFLIGNVGCALSDSMEMLILFRLIKGVAAAGILPVSNIILGSVLSIEDRAKFQGHISLVWGIGALLGPLIGALIVSAWGWRWIFYLTIPILIAIIVMMKFAFKDVLEPKKMKINYFSVIYFAISSVCLLAYTINLKGLWLVVGFIVAGLLFIKNERKTTNPLLPMSLWENKTIIFFNVNAFLIFFALFGMENYIPTYLQTYQNVGILLSGLILASISVGWAISSYLLRPLMKKYRYATIVLMGNFISLISVLMMFFYDQTTHWVVMVIILLMQGISYGMVQTCSMLASYEIVTEENKPMASSLQSFSRNIGTAFSVGYLGHLLVNDLENMLKTASIVAVVLILLGTILYKKLIISKN